MKGNSRVDRNGLNGIQVTGDRNKIKGNATGSGRGLGNGRSGINVSGADNAVDSNKASANAGDGFRISGGTATAPNTVRSNQSNLDNADGNRENGGAEFRLLGFVKGLGGNKADGIGVPKTGSPPKCPAFPATNQTVVYAGEWTCE